MRIPRLVVVAVVGGITLVACAMDAVSAQLPAPQAEVARKELVLPEGTQLAVTTTDTISSKTSSKGDALVFRVMKAVVVNNYVVIAEGAVVKATVSEVSGAGHFGKGGKLSVNVESTRATDGQSVKLRAAQGKEGDSNMKSTVALTVLLGPIGLFRKGDDVVMKPGTEIKVFTDQDVKVALP